MLTITLPSLFFDEFCAVFAEKEVVPLKRGRSSVVIAHDSALLACIKDAAHRVIAQSDPNIEFDLLLGSARRTLLLCNDAAIPV